VHGDLKLNNCIFDPSDPDRVRAVLDWDMTTIGDPLVDLGTLLNYWPTDGPAGLGSAIVLPELQNLHLATREELADRYVAATGLSLEDLDFYVALAAWKTAVVLQQLYTRYVQGDSSDSRLGEWGGQVAVMAEVADGVLAGPS
jgi:aminoglycoside phosphotransferase (APT) family kinase protein